MGNISVYKHSRAPYKSTLIKVVTYYKINRYNITNSCDNFSKYNRVLSIALDAKHSLARPSSNNRLDKEVMLRGKVNRGNVGEKVAADNSDEPRGLEVSYANRLISS